MRKLTIAVAAMTIGVLSVGAVRGIAARKQEHYPCSHEVKKDGGWRGMLSLDDAQRLRKKAVRVGRPIAVRLKAIGRTDVVPTIKCVARAYGMAPAPFIAVAECETHLTPDENLYQYIEGTWASASKRYGHAGAPRSDAYANLHTTVQYVQDGGWEPWTCKP